MPFEVCLSITVSTWIPLKSLRSLALRLGSSELLIAWLQLRRTPRLPSATHLADSGTQTSPVPRSPLVGIVLRPPTGRLPDHVWGREEIIHQADDTDSEARWARASSCGTRRVRKDHSCLGNSLSKFYETTSLPGGSRRQDQDSLYFSVPTTGTSAWARCRARS